MTTQAQPTLATDRLFLRPFRPDDAPTVQRLAGDRAIADTAERIPHPYADGMAEAWIAAHAERFRGQKGCTFAMTAKPTGKLIGAIGLTLSMAHSRGDLGYWIGKRFWGQGYCIEGARAPVAFRCTALGLHRIQARHMSRNPACGRVMAKLGMQHEGWLRGYMRKWGVVEDVDVYGPLREDWP